MHADVPCGLGRLGDAADSEAVGQFSRAPSVCICVHPPSSALRFFSEYFLSQLLVTKETKISNATPFMAAIDR
jgi:hypothetical protein